MDWLLSLPGRPQRSRLAKFLDGHLGQLQILRVDALDLLFHDVSNHVDYATSDFRGIL